MNLGSQLVQDAVDAFAKFPGVGRKSALRMVLHLLRKDPSEARGLGDTLHRLVDQIRYCKRCYHFSDDVLCAVCSNPRRQHETVCVVADPRDLMAIESTGQYAGTYHVLGGLIAPLEGVQPEHLQIEALVERVTQGGVTEVLLALNSTHEGETTAFYVSRKLAVTGVRLSTLARGVAVGAELEYADELTLAKSIAERVPFRA
jgi:recombination protein RecR